MDVKNDIIFKSKIIVQIYVLCTVFCSLQKKYYNIHALH